MAIDPDVEILLEAINLRLSGLEQALSALRSSGIGAVHPHTVIQQYDDNTELTYTRS